MGYHTDFSGSIDLGNSSGKDRKRLDQILRNRFPYAGDEIQIENTKGGLRLNVFGNWKNYHEEFEKFVMALVRSFGVRVSGWIDAQGEDRDDLWALEIKDGKVFHVAYEEIIKTKTVLFDSKGGRKND